MESGPEDAGPGRRPTLACSWEAARGSLARNLHLARARDADWEELLAPPAPGQELTVLTRSLSGPEEQPCFLHLRCDPQGGQEICSVGVLSSARNMEVYLGEEYCGTCRGQRVCSVFDDSEHEKIILYKKYLKLETFARACKIKLLSFGEKQCVFLSKVLVHVKPVPASSSPSFPALGYRIDLERVQSIMESMGSKLSPGAQQLMNMVKFQQQNCIPIGEQLQSVLGSSGCKLTMDLQPGSTLGSLDKSTSTLFPIRTGPTSGNGTEDIKAYFDKSTKPPDDRNSGNLEECKIEPPNRSLLENDLKNTVSSFLPKKASDSPELLPFLQNLCSQVNHLRVGHSAKWQDDAAKPHDGIAGVAMEEQPICAYLEKILSKNMELMEKKLTDYIDQRVYKLQEHLDNKLAVLVDLLQNPSSSPSEMPLRHYDSGERLTNGER